MHKVKTWIIGYLKENNKWKPTEKALQERKVDILKITDSLQQHVTIREMCVKSLHP